MDKSTAKTINRVVSVLEYIGGGLAVLGGIFIFLLGNEAGTDVAMLSFLGRAVGIVVIALGLLGLAIGYGLWTQRNWARILVLIGAGISALGALMDLFSGNAGAIVQLAISGVLIWLYAFQKDMRKLFK
jgi:hypothetical protein